MNDQEHVVVDDRAHGASADAESLELTEIGSDQLERVHGGTAVTPDVAGGGGRGDN